MKNVRYLEKIRKVRKRDGVVEVKVAPVPWKSNMSASKTHNNNNNLFKKKLKLEYTQRTLLFSPGAWV